MWKWKKKHNQVQSDLHTIDPDVYQLSLYEECIASEWDPYTINTLGEELAHLHEEVSEAFKAWRKYRDCEIRYEDGKPEGVPIEFADIIIGLFYNAELHGFDLFNAIEVKREYNRKRNYVKEGRQLHA